MKIKQLIISILFIFSIKGMEDEVKILFDAIKANDPKKFEEILNSGIDVNQVRGRADSTLLHSAIASGSAPMVKALLERKADINVFNDTDFCPLHEAAMKDDVEIAKMLLSGGAALNVNAKDIDNRTPLHLAKSSAIADLLIAAGADHTAFTSTRRSPTSMALWAFNSDVLISLLGNKKIVIEDIVDQAGDFVSTLGLKRDKYMLVYAIAINDIEYLKQLFSENKIGKNELNRKYINRMTVFMWAALMGHNDAINLLLDYRFKPVLDRMNSYNETALTLAQKYKHKTAEKLIIEAINGFVLQYAVTNKNVSGIIASYLYGLIDNKSECQFRPIRDDQKE